MMYLAIKLLHIISSTILFGTGIGSAFSMWRANASNDPRVIASITRSVVIADWAFTTPAVIVQPLTGIAMARLAGFPITTPWLLLSIALYVFVGACWLPVVWLQIKMKSLAHAAVASEQPMPALYNRYFAIWFALGWPAFASVLAIFALMVLKPVFSI